MAVCGYSADELRTSWCVESKCYIGQDGRVVHRSAGESIIDRGMLTVRMIDRATTEVVLIPEMTCDLAQVLTRYADCAMGHSAGPV